MKRKILWLWLGQIYEVEKGSEADKEFEDRYNRFLRGGE
jgi:hypothetical protein